MEAGLEVSASNAEAQLTPKKKNKLLNFLKRSKQDKSDNTGVLQLTHLDPPARPFAVRVMDKSKHKVNGETKESRGINAYVPWPMKKDTKKDVNPAKIKAETTEPPTVPHEAPANLASDQLKRKKITIQEFQNQFYTLAMQEIDTNLGNNQKWNGTFPESSREYATLQKRAQKSHLLTKDMDLKTWLVYIRIQCASNAKEPIVAHLLPQLFDKIRNHLSHNSLNKEDIDTFWKWTEQLVDNLTEAWILKCDKSGQAYFSDDPDALRILGVISEYFAGRRLILEEAEGNAQTQFLYSLEKIQTAISNQAKTIFNAKIGTPTLDNLVLGIQVLMKDLYKDQHYLKNVFHSYGLPSHLNAYDTVYSMWDYQLSECVKVLQEESLSTLQPIEFIDGNPVTSQKFDYKKDDSLLELYKVLRNFAMLTDKPPLPNFVHIKGSFHNGFRPFVTQWLDIVCLRTVSWIELAILGDSFEPITSKSKISSSAVDTAEMFTAMKASWTELKWPDINEAYSYAVLMLENFSRCMQYYVDKIYKRVWDLEDNGFEQFEISDEFCMASNNVEFVCQELRSTLDQLCISDIIRKLSIGSNPDSTALEQCTSTPPNLIENLTEKVQRTMSDSLIISCAKQVAPMLQILYLHVAHSADEREAEIGSDRIVIHLSSVLTKLKANLTETEFMKAFPIIWRNAFESLHVFVQDSLVTLELPSFYNNLSITFAKLRALFFGEELDSLAETDRLQIEELENIIKLHGNTTRELILEYFQERIENQKLLGRSESCGTLTLLMDYCETTEHLKIKILNATLTKYKSGEPNPYVRFQIRTRAGDKAPPKYDSKVKRGTCPRFEQEFELKLPKSELESGAYLHLWLKQGRYPYVEFLGETFLSLHTIQFNPLKKNIDDQPQTKLPLSRPTSSKYIGILERRKSEGLAFATIQKSRIE